jgi:hypothetical protein
MHYAFRFLLSVLAVWRLTHLLAKEDGPWRIFSRLRGSFLRPLLSCFYCLSLWLAAPFVWFTSGTTLERAVTWLALSGAAMLLEKATEERLEIEIESEEEEPEHELLRAKRRAAGH